MRPEIVLFLTVGAVLISLLYFRARMHTDRVLQSLAEKGLPIPTELFRKADTQDMRSRYIAWGIILIAVGLATITFFSAVIHFEPGTHIANANGEYDGPPLWLPFIGSFPLFTGAACLLVGWLQPKHD